MTESKVPRRNALRHVYGHANASIFAFFIALLTAIFPLTAATASPTIYLVRHAERAAVSGRVPADTGLSRAGQARAQSLAHLLSGAGISAIYTTEYRRTQETAAPLARSLRIRLILLPKPAWLTCWAILPRKAKRRHMRSCCISAGRSAGSIVNF